MITRIFAEYLIIAAALWVAHVVGPWAWFPATLVIGSRQHALGIIGHWAMHGLLPKWQMWACFAPVAIDPDVYRASHAWHHGYLGTEFDPEVRVVRKYASRWGKLNPKTLIADALWLHLDESVSIMRLLASARSIAIYSALILVLFVLIGPIALLVPASVNGLLMTHRLRARAEHDHIMKPGATFTHSSVPIWAFWHLPHFAWLHAEHHAKPNQKVWE